MRKLDECYQVAKNLAILLSIDDRNQGDDLTLISIIPWQHYDAVAFVESFAEYVPAPCTHRPSSQPSGGLVRPMLNRSNQGSARWIKS